MNMGHVQDAPGSPSFTRKQISVTFNIVMPDGSTQSLTLESDYQIKASVTHSGLSIGSRLSLDIRGLSIEDMNRLACTVNYPSELNHNTMNQSSSTVILRVGDYGQPLTTLFTGLIGEGQANLNERVFHVQAMTSPLLARIIPRLKSDRGPRNVISILSDICNASGLQLTNHGGWNTHATLTNTYLEGTTLQMLQKIVEHACHGVYDFVPFVPETDENDGTGNRKSYVGTINVWGPAYDGMTDDVTRNTIPLISDETGLIGFPNYSRSGVSFTCSLRTDIAYYQPVRLESLYPPGVWNQSEGHTGKAPWSGIWYPTSITHDVTSETRDGSWHTSANCRLAGTGMKNNDTR